MSNYDKLYTPQDSAVVFIEAGIGFEKEQTPEVKAK
jgi:hypothetical protein